MQDYCLNTIANTVFKKLDLLYKKDFLNLDMEYILNESFLRFEEQEERMNPFTSRNGWACFLERTVLNYIQCMLNSSSKIR